MAKQKFKPGDKVKFTQEAKDRYHDSGYWDWLELDLDKVYTVERYGNRYCTLKEQSTAAYIADYLLEPAEQTKKKNMVTKKDFILALVQVILPDYNITYEGCKPYAKVHTIIGTITVKCPKDKKGNVWLTLSPIYGNFKETDIELVTKFLDQNCNLECPEGSIEVTDHGDLTIHLENYPWYLVDEIKPIKIEEPVQEDKPSSCDTCEVVRKLQAEIQRLKYELNQTKAEKSQTGSDWCKKPKRTTVTFEF